MSQPKDPAEYMASLFDKPRFDGGVDPQGVEAYEPDYDNVRLTGQIRRVVKVMINGEWRTLDEIATATGDPHASISAQLRHLRKERFGSHVVLKRARGNRAVGLWEYSLLWNAKVPRP